MRTVWNLVSLKLIPRNTEKLSSPVWRSSAGYPVRTVFWAVGHFSWEYWSEDWRLDHTLQSSHLLADSVRRILLGRFDSYPGLHSSTRESPSLEGSILLDCLSPQPQLYDLLVLSHGLNIRIRIHSLDSRSLQALCTLISTEENISGDAIFVPLTEWRRKYLSVLTFSGGASLVWS